MLYYFMYNRLKNLNRTHVGQEHFFLIFFSILMIIDAIIISR